MINKGIVIHGFFGSGKDLFSTLLKRAETELRMENQCSGLQSLPDLHMLAKYNDLIDEYTQYKSFDIGLEAKKIYCNTHNIPLEHLISHKGGHKNKLRKDFIQYVEVDMKKKHGNDYWIKNINLPKDGYIVNNMRFMDGEYSYLKTLKPIFVKLVRLAELDVWRDLFNVIENIGYEENKISIQSFFRMLECANPNHKSLESWEFEKRNAIDDNLFHHIVVNDDSLSDLYGKAKTIMRTAIYM